MLCMLLNVHSCMCVQEFQRLFDIEGLSILCYYVYMYVKYQ